MDVELNLYQALAEAFSIGELQQLCEDLGIDYEFIGGPGSTKDIYILRLVTHFQRRDELSRLVARCDQLRPSIPWASLSIPTHDQAIPSSKNLKQKIWMLGFAVAGFLIVLAINFKPSLPLSRVSPVEANPTLTVTIISTSLPISSVDIDATDVAEGFPIDQTPLDGEIPIVWTASSPFFRKLNSEFGFNKSKRLIWSLLFPSGCVETDSGVKVISPKQLDVVIYISMTRPYPENLVYAYVKINNFNSPYGEDIDRYQIGREGESSPIHETQFVSTPITIAQPSEGRNALPLVSIQPQSRREWIYHGQKIRLIPSPDKGLGIYFPLRLTVQGSYRLNFLLMLENKERVQYLVVSPMAIMYGVSVVDSGGKRIIGANFDSIYDATEYDTRNPNMKPIQFRSCSR